MRIPDLFVWLLLFFGLTALLTLVGYILDKKFPSKESLLEKAIREADEKREKDNEKFQKFALWGTCNQIELEKAIEEDKRAKNATSKTE